MITFLASSTDGGSAGLSVLSPTSEAARYFSPANPAINLHGVERVQCPSHAGARGGPEGYTPTPECCGSLKQPKYIFGEKQVVAIGAEVAVDAKEKH